jgi:hypothetical protein
MALRPPNLQFQIFASMLLTVFAYSFGGSVPRIIPGGPAISIVGDVLPCLAAVSGIGFAFGCLRARSTWPKVLCFVITFINIVAIKNVIVSVYTFWTNRFARGDLIGL